MRVQRSGSGDGRSGGAGRLATIAALAVLAGSLPAAAEPQAGPAADAGRIAQAGRSISFEIAPQPLATALDAFSRTTGWQVGYTSGLDRGQPSPGVRGPHAPLEALERLLAGTGLRYRMVGAESVTLEPAPVQSGDGSLSLGPITVQGQSESAYGRVDGYVATRSATASKSDTPLIEIPHSVSVVPRRQVEAQASQTVNQALRYTPGVVTETRGVATRYDGVQIRGFGGYVGSDQSTYLDGLRLLRNTEYSYPSVDPYTLERIEVFRGPASVLYGQSNPGGLTSLVSKAPTEQPLREVELQAGSHDRFQGAFDFAGPIDAPDPLQFRVTGLARDADSQIDHVEERRLLLAPSLAWSPTDETTLTFRASYQRDPEGGFYGWVPANGTIQANPNGKIPTSFFDGDPSFEEFERTQAMVGYSLEHRASDTWTFRQNARYVSLDLDYRQVYGLGLQADNRTLNRGTALSDESTGAFAIDNQAHARFATGPLAHALLAGADFYRLDSDVRSGFGSAPTLDVFNPVYGQTITDPAISVDKEDEQHQFGLYLQDQIKLGRLTLTLGGRHDWAEQKTTDQTTGATAEQSNAAFTGKAGAVYELANGLAPYASYSESFLPVPGTDFDGGQFDPETGRQYEIGIKYQPSGYDSFVTLAAFDLVRQNVTTGDPDHVGFSIQTGEVRSRGVEAEARLNLLPGFYVLAAYTYLDAEITASNNGDAGNRPSSVPEHMASLWADYTFQEAALAGLGIGVGVRYVGEAYGDNANSFSVPSYTIYDASIRYDLGQLLPQLDGVSMQLAARNLLDEEYVASCEFSDAFCYYGDRRTLLASVKYRW